MTLQKALELKENNKGLVGKIIKDKGMRIADVFVAPIENVGFTQFIREYVRTRDNLLSLVPFANQEMTVKVRVESVDTPSINIYYVHSELSELLGSNI
jgi:hypothetical protein